MPRRRQPLMSYGIFLLAHDLFQTGFQHIPPITLVAVLAQAALFVGIINPPWEGYEVCLSGESILYYKDYRRLILSAIEHADDLHLYHNMVSLILKGRTLESRYGSLKFSVILLVFMISTSGMYLALSKALYMYFDDYSYMKQCAIGFSGVLFALKVLTTFEGGGTHWIHGFEVPSRLVVWVELLIIHILVPGSSFIGHLAGILVGIIYMFGPLRIIVDALCYLLRGRFFDICRPSYYRSYTYDRGTSSSHRSSGYRQETYGWNRDLHEEFDEDELRRRRLHRFS
ncbi:UNVERIFIED_CONTAM: hypothetical protein RMT77_003141 [Armadillidium vulgare]